MKSTPRRCLAGAAVVAALGCLSTPLAEAATSDEAGISPAALQALESELVATHGEDARPNVARGLRQVSDFWRPEDGDAEAFAELVRRNFAGTEAARDALFARFERVLEQVDGHMNEIGRAMSWQVDLDLGPLLPVDEMFAGYDPSAHVMEDLFANKVAFVALLNFPLTTLEERLGPGMSWTRRAWAEARLAQRFSKRVPSAVNLEANRLVSGADVYISTYNIWLHHVVEADGRRLFPARMQRLSHWGLRDELKAAYADPVNGLARQRTIGRIMDRIVDQSIPLAVIDNPGVDWNPVTNEVTPATVADAPDAVRADRVATTEREPDTRYATLLATFRAAQLVDRWSPTAPTLLARRFDENREIPEARVRALLEQVLTSPLVPHVAKLAEQRLGRPLEPFDIWYNGFRAADTVAPAELDRLTASRYPDAAAFQKDLPNLLGRLGFSSERAAFLADHIAIDPARGSGHASGGSMRGAKARLRTRVLSGGMDYQGFNIAAHELGHNVEQVFSQNLVDHTLLAGVPNNAFTEAMAFVFQARDLRLLGVAPKPDPMRVAMSTLDDFWGTYEIAGVALVDIEVWHWMYDHPDATPAELRDATLAIAKDVWNRYYASVLGARDVPLLAIYSHILRYQLYTPDYALGSLIAFQVEEHLRGNDAIGPEIERMASCGCVAPDLWMQNATGAPVSADALLAATARAVEAAGAASR